MLHLAEAHRFSTGEKVLVAVIDSGIDKSHPEIANAVADHPSMRHNKRIAGRGRVISDLEWDVKVYLALNGAVHDAAIWAWGNKNVYDSSRPISLIRYMAYLGQSSDPSVPRYDCRGLPLVPGLIELITPTRQPGEHHAGSAVTNGRWRSERGSRPADPATQAGGAGGSRVDWMPYSRRTS